MAQRKSEREATPNEIRSCCALFVVGALLYVGSIMYLKRDQTPLEGDWSDYQQNSVHCEGKNITINLPTHGEYHSGEFHTSGNHIYILTRNAPGTSEHVSASIDYSLSSDEGTLVFPAAGKPPISLHRYHLGPTFPPSHFSGK